MTVAAFPTERARSPSPEGTLDGKLAEVKQFPAMPVAVDAGPALAFEELFPPQGCLTPLDRRDDPHGLAQFSTDNEIGALTGLAKRFADLDLYEETKRIEDEDIRARAVLGIVGSYYTRDAGIKPPKTFIGRTINRWKHRVGAPTHESRMIEHIIADEDNPLRGKDVCMIEQEIRKPDQSRFEKLHYDFKQLKEDEQTLVQKNYQMKYGPMSRPLPGLSDEEQSQRSVENERDRYKVLKQLLGISLAEGDIDQAVEYAEEIKSFPNRKAYETSGHTAAVIKYLDEGGADVLKARARHPRYLLQDYIGSANHPGKLRDFMNDLKNEGIASTIVNIAYVVLGAAATVYAVNHHKEIMDITNQVISTAKDYGYHIEGLRHYVGSNIGQ